MKSKITLLGVAFTLIGITACGPMYSNDPGPTSPPAVVGMEWTHPGGSIDCGLGILADGSAFVAGALGHPFLAAGITWLGYVVTGESYPPGGSIAACWNESQYNINEFNLYTQCYGQPVLKSTWTSFSGAQAWVQIPTCRNCNRACQGFSNFVNPLFDWKANHCDNPAFWMDLLCFAINHPNSAMTDTTENPPPGTTTDLPWQSDMVPPGWDVTVPPPPTLPS